MHQDDLLVITKLFHEGIDVKKNVHNKENNNNNGEYYFQYIGILMI